MSDGVKVCSHDYREPGYITKRCQTWDDEASYHAGTAPKEQSTERYKAEERYAAIIEDRPDPNGELDKIAQWFMGPGEHTADSLVEHSAVISLAVVCPPAAAAIALVKSATTVASHQGEDVAHIMDAASSAAHPVH